jgi:hypothetical protein
VSKSRQEVLEEELSALQSLGKIESRRVKSLETHTKMVHGKYDALRGVALQSIPEAVQKTLADTDEAHQAYLVRQGVPLEVSEKDIQEA